MKLYEAIREWRKLIRTNTNYYVCDVTVMTIG